MAVVLLKVERARIPAMRPARDGAAPLIGSSDAMQQVRKRIEG